jgi:SAM-dependent methyltransferase
MAIKSDLPITAVPVERLPHFSREFDFVVGKAVLHHLTHDQERELLRLAASVLREDGEARFTEPCVNWAALDTLRWMIPVPGRPSLLNKRAFAAWRAADPHPRRDNSSAHFESACGEWFRFVKTTPLGGLDRLERITHHRPTIEAICRIAYAVDSITPDPIHRLIARGQRIVCREPRV